MIVKMTESLKQKYDELFASMQTTLETISSDTSLGTLQEDAAKFKKITSLPTYYDALDYLLTNSDKLTSYMKNEFIHLPLDEDPIVVNMNTRKIITSGTHFGTEGVGVRGDAFAEIIFFEADRFFDTMDLGACKCYINWTNGSARGISTAIAVDKTDDEIDENGAIISNAKILFGWVITDSMTNSGNSLTFSVNFSLKAQVEGVETTVFNLTTESASLRIKEGLILNPDEIEPEDVSNIIFSRPVYAQVINSTKGASPLIDEVFEPGIYHLVQGEQGPEYKFTIIASSPDDGHIVFEWYKNDSRDQFADTKVSSGAIDNYVARTAGTYYVRVGNKTDNGIRTITTPSALIPAASPITRAGGTNLLYGWAPKNADDKPENYTALEIKVHNPDIEDKSPIYPAVMKYTWKRAPFTMGVYTVPTLDQYTDIGISTETDLFNPEGELTKEAWKASVLTNTITPTEEMDGWYICAVENSLNNTTTVLQLNKADSVLIRRQPRDIENVTCHLENGILTCSVVAPTDLFEDEIEYLWTGTKETLMGTRDTKSLELSKSLPVTTELKNDGTYTYAIDCFIKNTVYKSLTNVKMAKSGGELNKRIHIKATMVDGLIKYELIN